MANNISITQGSGTTIATEQGVGSEHYQKVKLIDPTAGVTTPIGNTANPMVVAGNVASGSSDSGNPLKTGVVYNSTPPTLTSGQRGDAQGDVNANTKIALGANLAGEDLSADRLKVEHKYTPISYTTAQTATTAVTGVGVLHAIVIWGGTASQITVWDNTVGSGTNYLVPPFTPGNVTIPVTVLLNESFANGVTITTTAATIITLLYRVN